MAIVDRARRCFGRVGKRRPKSDIASDHGAAVVPGDHPRAPAGCIPGVRADPAGRRYRHAVCAPDPQALAAGRAIHRHQPARSVHAAPATRPAIGTTCIGGHDGDATVARPQCPGDPTHPGHGIRGQAISAHRPPGGDLAGGDDPGRSPRTPNVPPSASALRRVRRPAPGGNSGGPRRRQRLRDTPERGRGGASGLRRRRRSPTRRAARWRSPVVHAARRACHGGRSIRLLTGSQPAMRQRQRGGAPAVPARRSKAPPRSTAPAPATTGPGPSSLAS